MVVAPILADIDARRPTISRTAGLLLLIACALQSATALAADEHRCGTVKFRIRCSDAAANNLPGDGTLEVDLPSGGVANVFYWGPRQRQPSTSGVPHQRARQRHPAV
jgi:hypothetical protein